MSLPTGINLAGVVRILDLKGRLDERDDELDVCIVVYASLPTIVHELETRESVNSLVPIPTQLYCAG